ncbi:MAG: ATP-binding protein [Caldilineaceae bacterium]|nr:ATP-binding protein [Caldilineaceae bacterium]
MSDSQDSPRFGDLGAGVDDNLIHLQAELTRMDAHLRRYAHLRAQAASEGAQNRAPNALFDAPVHALLEMPLGAIWSPDPHGQSADDWMALCSMAAEQSESVARTMQANGETPRLLRLRHLLSLSQFDVDLLLIALAPVLEPRLAALYAYLSDQVLLRCPTVDLALNVLCGAGLKRLGQLAHFDDDAPLFRHHLLRWVGDPETLNGPQTLRTFGIDPAISRWLLGSYEPTDLLRPYANLRADDLDENESVIGAEAWQALAKARHGQSLFGIFGPDGSPQSALARRIAVEAQRPLLTFDVAAYAAAGEATSPAIRLILRDGLLTGAIVHLAGIDGCLVDGVLPADLLDAIVTHPDTIIVSSGTRWQLQGVGHRRPILWLNVPLPSDRQSGNLWRHFLGESMQLDEQVIASLVAQFHLTSDQIRDAVAAATDSVVQRGTPLNAEDIFAAARSRSSTQLGKLAQKITPRYEWGDLVLPDNQLEILLETVAAIRGRTKVLQEWGLGRKLVSSPAITMLFAGDPGTGKTMAAEVIAMDLGIDLYKIDLSSMVSKYIGETEKNLDTIFKEAQQSNALLFFDEADAIFGKRTAVKDSHDRYANIGVSYLLQRMESYDGITILATNLRSNLDDAFIRRLQFVVDFPFPDAEDRLRIWHTLIPADLPVSPDLDFSHFAQRLKISGGHIRNIIVAAAYLAADDNSPVSMDHLRHAARRELQKLGRMVAEVDLDDPEADAASSPHTPSDRTKLKAYRLRYR